MRILILGGDGYLGWPTAMYFSNLGYDVAVLDNMSKRNWEAEMSVSSLVPIPTFRQRIKAWEKATEKKITGYVGDITNYNLLLKIFKEFLPDVIIHYAEQPSAPYSMLTRGHAVYTQTNNIVGTLNVVFAMKSIVPDCHLVKLGTMGEYGTPNIDIEEGFIEIKHRGRKDVLPFPKQPGSFYHLSKVHDSHNIQFVCKTWNLRATDLNQGVVYGIETEESILGQDLITSFHYDAVFGTVLNRFCVQAVAGVPLTVYGKGGQTRGYLNILDTLQCVRIAVENPPDCGEFRVLNQFTEVFSVKDLAEIVKDAAGKFGLKVRVKSIKNPRIEQEEHYYNPRNEKFLKLGLKPHKLSDVLVCSMLKRIMENKNFIDISTIMPSVRWKEK